jgi:hypothetical protein
MRGVPMGVIAAQLGYQDIWMTEKHYAHLAPSYIAPFGRIFRRAVLSIKPPSFRCDDAKVDERWSWVRRYLEMATTI